MKCNVFWVLFFLLKPNAIHKLKPANEAVLKARHSWLRQAAKPSARESGNPQKKTALTVRRLRIVASNDAFVFGILGQPRQQGTSDNQAITAKI